MEYFLCSQCSQVNLKHEIKHAITFKVLISREGQLRIPEMVTEPTHSPHTYLEDPKVSQAGSKVGYSIRFVFVY